MAGGRRAPPPDPDAELLARIHKLHDIYQVLQPDGGDLHLPTAWKRVSNFDASTRSFVSTLLQALTVWIAPEHTLSEEDFIRRLVRQMMTAEQAQNKKTVREFLGRMERGDAVKAQTEWIRRQQNVKETTRECTFQPAVNFGLPETTYTPDVPLRSQPDYVSAEPPPPPAVEEWVKRLYRPPTAEHQWLPPTGVNALRGVEPGVQHPVTGQELQPFTGQRLDAATMSSWVANLRSDPPSAPGPGGPFNAWQDHSLDNSQMSGSVGDDVDVTPGGRRRKIYGSAAGSTMGSATPKFQRPKGSSVNNIGTAARVPKYKWKDRLRGGYLAAKLDTSAVELRTRQRLYECTVRSFKQYELPPSQYHPPFPYDEYTPIPEPTTRHVPGARI